MSDAAKTTIPERPALASFFASLTDVPFELPIKDVGEALYTLCALSSINASPTTTTGSAASATEGAADDDAAGTLELAPAKLHLFKEQTYARTGKKFGFVEFCVRERAGVASPSPAAAPAQSTDAAAATAAAAATLNAELLHAQIDAILARGVPIFSSAAEASAPPPDAGAPQPQQPFVLRRIPDPIVEHLAQSPLVSKAKDATKVLCMLCKSVARRPGDSTTTTTTTTTTEAATTSAAPAQPATSAAPLWRLGPLAITDLALLRQEHPELFPAVANSESIAAFMKATLPASDHLECAEEWHGGA